VDPAGRRNPRTSHQILRPSRLGAFQKNVIIRIGAHSRLLCGPDPETLFTNGMKCAGCDLLTALEPGRLITSSYSA
jgi:hypothetical protein